ncbi:MAG: glycosyltransferase family 2 protein [Sphingobacteriales bacterium]|nr:MAG: glycosyltransferase family 2 protein [Sphingobacteriales bacterium]
MKPLSVVIICRNEEKIIGTTIESVKDITDDIVCVDNGSTDNTLSVIKQFGARLEETIWEGFGKTRNKALAFAKYDWILMLDADEPVDTVLKQSILNENFTDPYLVYKLTRKNYFAGTHLKFGEWGRKASHIRLFHRDYTKWEEAEVHEKVILPPGAVVKTLNGHILHYTADNVTDFETKMTKYAFLSAHKYYRYGTKSNFFKIYISPVFSFILNYFFRLGFLDGTRGFFIARTSALYTHLKYVILRKMQRS